MRRKHHDLMAWQESMVLVEKIYFLTKDFPSDERFGLTNQMRRAAVSIPSNIAEGAGRSGDKEFPQFLAISRGSLCELETQLLIAKRLGYIEDTSSTEQHIGKVFALLGGLMNTIKSRSNV